MATPSRAVRRLESTPSDASDAMFQILAARAASVQDAKLFGEEDALDGTADNENSTEDTRSGSPVSSTPDLLEQEVQVEEESGGESFQAYGRQVGGHFRMLKPVSSPSGCIMVRKGSIGAGGDDANVDIPLQQIILKPADETEHAFYYRMLPESVPVLAPHVPIWYGTKKLSHQQLDAMVEEARRKAKGEMAEWQGGRERSNDFDTFIALEDLANGMAAPCILDLKMGFKQRSRRYNEAKRLRCRQKASGSTSGSIGFRLCGLRADHSFRDKYFGREIGKAELLRVLEEYFEPLQIEAWKQHIIVGLLARLRELRAAVSACAGWRFWNTSLLLLYDSQGAERPPELRLIDFAHFTAVKDATPDKEFLTALHNVEVFLEALLSGHSLDWVLENLLEPPGTPEQDQEELDEEEEQQPRCFPVSPCCTQAPEDPLGAAELECSTPPFGAKRERSPTAQGAWSGVLPADVLPMPAGDGQMQDAGLALEAKRLKHMSACEQEADIALLRQPGAEEISLEWGHVDSTANLGYVDQPLLAPSLLSLLQPTAFIKQAPPFVERRDLGAAVAAGTQLFN